MKIAVIGAGYVGLVTAACLAKWGHEVACVDTNVQKIDGLKNGVMPIYEPGLDRLVAEVAGAGLLTFTTRLEEAVSGVSCVFIAVGTPPSPGEGDADLSFVYMVARDVAPLLEAGAVVVVKSTVPVGTGDAVERIIGRVRPAGSFSVASNPEFLREGSAIGDFQTPDRVVLGIDDGMAKSTMLEVYGPIVDRAPIVITDRRTSELIKYAANSFLATKITFINEMADLCERTGADIADLALGMGLDRRIGQNFLNAGPGFGGSCFPKDTLALIRTAQNYGVALRIVEESIAVNNARKRKMALKVMQAMGGNVDGRTIAVLGLSFKANTDDLRETPAIPLIDTLRKFGARIHATDPAALSNARREIEGAYFFEDPYSCAAGADALVIVTDWDEYRQLDLPRLRRVMGGKVLIDLRNIIPASQAEELGFELTGLDRAARPAGAAKGAEKRVRAGHRTRGAIPLES